MGSRIKFRQGNGRFRRAPSLEALGFPVAKGAKECAECGHEWYPVLTTGVCPKCGSAEGQMREATDE